MSTNDSLQRSVLPIPDRRPTTLTTYDAKDPATRFHPITPLRPPDRAPNVLVICLTMLVSGPRVGLVVPSRIRRLLTFVSRRRLRPPAVLRLLRPRATHGPHHVPKDWIAKHTGK